MLFIRQGNLRPFVATILILCIVLLFYANPILMGGVNQQKEQRDNDAKLVVGGNTDDATSKYVSLPEKGNTVVVVPVVVDDQETSNDDKGDDTEEESMTISHQWDSWYTELWDNALLSSKNKIQTIENASFFNGSLMTQYHNVLSKMNVSELFETFPNPIGADVIQIYNTTTYNELVHTFMTEPKRITICANGGSVTSGGGHIKKEHRYYSKLVEYLKEVGVNANGAQIQMINRGHGHRHSLHSAIFAPSFIPPETDLILWEFSVNDSGYGIVTESSVEQERSILIAWLSEIERLRSHSPPPKVILIYLWKRPFNLNGQGKIDNPVYDAHENLGKEFDFVVGHINVASYIDGLQLRSLREMKQLFLADVLHPNETGHLIISFLLLNLLKGISSSTPAMDLLLLDNQEQEYHPNGKSSTLDDKHHHPEQYMWYCGTENEDKRFVRSQITQYNSEDNSFRGWRSPLGVSTMEEPQNDIKPGSRQLIFNEISSTSKITLGKQDPLRIDRQKGVALSCCRGDNASISRYTTVSVPEGSKPMKNVQSLFLGFAPTISDVKNLKVYVGSTEQIRNADGRLVRVLNEEWPCFWSWKDIYTPIWYAFSEEQAKISKIHMCVENDHCSVEEKGDEQSNQSQTYLISVAVY